MKTNCRLSAYPLISLTIILIDQWIKQSIRILPIQEDFYSVPGLFELTHTTNTGAAFSMLSGQRNLIVLFSIVLLAALGLLFSKATHLTKSSKVALSILIGAGAGNLIDRVFFGGVTDYIRFLFIRFPVFNFADVCITCSVIVLSIFIMTGRLDKQPEELTHGSND